MTTSRLALASFLLSVGGLVAAAALFACVYVQCLPNGSYLWSAVAICLTQLPALVMSIPTRSLPLGRAAMALSSSLLVGMVVGFLVLTPFSPSSRMSGFAEPSCGQVGLLNRCDAPTSAPKSTRLRTDHLAGHVQHAHEGVNLYA